MLAIADYHLKNILVALEVEPGEDQTIRLYAHIRAFFWELYSIGELVDHSSVPDLEKLKNSAEWKEWWSVIYEYRNVAHKTFFEIQIVLPGTMDESSAPELEHLLSTYSPSLMRGEIDFLLPAARRTPLQAQFPQIPDDLLFGPPGKDYLSRLLEYASDTILPRLP